MPPSRVSFKASVASTLLRSNYTPQGLLRAFGCFGRERVHMLVARRFGSDRWSTEEAELISDYLYHISAQPSGGENALNALLQLIFTTVPGPDGPFYRPKVLARKPITPAELAAGLTPSRGAPTSSGPDRSSLSSVNPSIPLLLMYGDSDWLSFPGARKFADVLKGDLGTEVTFATIRNAGHHLYMDNAGQFHSTIDTWMQKHFPPPSV
jgi:pimeloyl-ACP methyl ester carboxylesterase